MIEVKGPNVFKGYWRMPEKTKAEFRDDGFFITGDLGKIDDKGYVHILGRGKDLVISGGFNVYPKEIESEIDAMPGVIESAVIGVPHADFGEGVTAVVVCNKGADVTEAGVLKALDGTAGEIQDAEARVRGRRTAAQRHGQGAEEYFAGYLREDLREVVCVVPANAGTHTPRRIVLRDAVRRLFSNHGHLWLWVPAFGVWSLGIGWMESASNEASRLSGSASCHGTEPARQRRDDAEDACLHPAQ